MSISRGSLVRGGWRVVLAVVLLAVGACTRSGEPSSTTAPETADTTLEDEDGGSTAPPTTVPPVQRDEVVITEDQTYPDGVVIPTDESWVLDPDTSITLTSSGNIEVLGELVMQPSSGDVEHVLRFEGIDESAGRLEGLLDMVAADEAEGIGDAPWPPHYPKMPGEPPRVQPSKMRKENWEVGTRDTELNPPLR